MDIWKKTYEMKVVLPHLVSPTKTIEIGISAIF